MHTTLISVQHNSMHSLTHSLTHSLAQPFTHSHVQSLAAPHTHACTHSPTVITPQSIPHSLSLKYSLTHLLTHLLTHSRTHSPTHPLTHTTHPPLTHTGLTGCTHSLTHSLTLLTPSATHLLTHSVLHACSQLHISLTHITLDSPTLVLLTPSHSHSQYSVFSVSMPGMANMVQVYQDGSPVYFSCARGNIPLENMTQWGMDNNDLGVEQDGGVQVLDFSSCSPKDKNGCEFPPRTRDGKHFAVRMLDNRTCTCTSTLSIQKVKLFSAGSTGVPCYLVYMRGAHTCSEDAHLQSVLPTYPQFFMHIAKHWLTPLLEDCTVNNDVVATVLKSHMLSFVACQSYAVHSTLLPLVQPTRLDVLPMVASANWTLAKNNPLRNAHGSFIPVTTQSILCLSKSIEDSTGCSVSLLIAPLWEDCIHCKSPLVQTVHVTAAEVLTPTQACLSLELDERVGPINKLSVAVKKVICFSGP